MPPSTASTIYHPRRLLPAALAILAAVLALAGASGLPPLVSAHGGGTPIATRESGPYRIEVSIQPVPAVVDSTHLSVLVRSRDGGQIITDAAVEAAATGPEGSAGLGPIPASNDDDPQYYEAILPFDREGTWDVTIKVSSEMGEETMVVPIDVGEGGGFLNWILIAAIGVAIVTVGVWTWDRVVGRRSQANEGAGQ